MNEEKMNYQPEKEDSPLQTPLKEVEEMITQNETEEQIAVLDSQEKIKVSQKNIITIAVCIILAVIIIFGTFIIIKHHNDVKAAENVITMIDELGEPSILNGFSDKINATKDAYDALTDKQKEYVSNKETLDTIYNKYAAKLRLSFFIPSIKSNAELCQAFFSDYASVWHNAIYRNTDEYNNGNFSDFNTALMNFQSSDTYVNAQKTLTKEHESIKNSWSTLDGANTLDDEAYQAIKKLYVTYQSMYELATNPAGSYNSYTEETKNLNSNYKTNYAEVVAVIPEATILEQ